MDDGMMDKTNCLRQMYLRAFASLGYVLLHFDTQCLPGFDRIGNSASTAGGVSLLRVQTLTHSLMCPSRLGDPLGLVVKCQNLLFGDG